MLIIGLLMLTHMHHDDLDLPPAKMVTDAVLGVLFLGDRLDVDFVCILLLKVAILSTVKQLPPQRRQPVVLGISLASTDGHQPD